MHYANQYGWDIICISESHLLEYLRSSFVDLPGYILFRHDVQGSVAKHGV